MTRHVWMATLGHSVRDDLHPDSAQVAWVMKKPPAMGARMNQESAAYLGVGVHRAGSQRLRSFGLPETRWSPT